METQIMNYVKTATAALVILGLAAVIAVKTIRKTLDRDQPRYIGHYKRKGWHTKRAVYEYGCSECGSYQEGTNSGKRTKLRITCQDCGTVHRWGAHRALKAARRHGET